MNEINTSRLSWDALGIATCNHDGDIHFQAHDSALEEKESLDAQSPLPQLSDAHQNIGCIYLPMEDLLTRPFSFPLKHRRFLDADMLGQELADTAGIEPDEWWLSWRSEKSSHGLAGMVFGLPIKTQQAIQSNPRWQQAPLLLIDGWERLHQWLNGIDTNDTFAVIDADAEGVFFGFFDDGAWEGMRRLNADMSDEDASTSIAQQVVWSLQSMGMQATETYVTGRLTPALAEEFPLAHPSSPPNIEHALPPRHILTLMLPNPLAVDKASAKHHFNIRHGAWAAKRSTASAYVWQRPALFAACLCFLWLGITIFDNAQLENQLSRMNDDVVAAFHRGLPEQPVIIDALAQLRQAAGNNSNPSQSNAYRTVEQLGHIGTAFIQYPWQMQELKMDKKGIFLAGKVESLSTLNAMRDALKKSTASDVNIADTDLSGNEVSFRMHWQ